MSIPRPLARFLSDGGALCGRARANERGRGRCAGATGNFSDWKVGTTFTYKAVAMNPPAHLGTVYVEVTSRGRDGLK